MTEKSLIQLAPDHMAALSQFLPDTPWTTPTHHVLEERNGAAYVDSPESPRNLVVVAQGGGSAEAPDQAFLFGLPSAHGMREFVSAVDAPTEFLCDEDLGALVREFHPQVTHEQYVVAWFDYLDVEVEVPDTVHARRLRMSDAMGLEGLLPAWAFRTYPNSRGLIMGGAAYGVFEGDDLVSAAFIVDHSVKFERVAVVTDPAYRRKGFAHAALSKLVNGALDRGRIPCCCMARDNVAAWKLTLRIGFPRRAVLNTYRRP